jgi:hypothetical protein
MLQIHIVIENYIRSTENLILTQSKNKKDFFFLSLYLSLVLNCDCVQKAILLNMQVKKYTLTSLLFNYLENSKALGEGVLDMKCVFHFCLQSTFKKVFCLINI